jgi:hypothetical protein
MWGAVTIMTSMPPEPPQQPAQWPAQQPAPWPACQPPFNPPPAYPPPPPDLPQPNMPRCRMSTVRIACGVLWASIAIVCAAGSVGEWLIGVHAGAVLCLVIAICSGWYDYRVWTSRSRRLIV